MIKKVSENPHQKRNHLKTIALYIGKRLLIPSCLIPKNLGIKSCSSASHINVNNEEKQTTKAIKKRGIK